MKTALARVSGSLSVLLLVLGCILSPLSFSAVFEVRDNQPYEALGTSLDIFRTSDSTLGIDEVSSPHTTAFSKVQVEQINLAYTDETIWLRIRLHNRDSEKIRLFLKSGFSRIDSMTLYAPDGSGGWNILKGGDRVPWSEWPVQSRLLTFPLNMEPLEEKTWYLKVNSTSTMQILLGVIGDTALVENTEQVFFSDGVFYGLCLAVIFVSLMMSLVFREGLYVFFLIHVVAGTLTVMSLDGSGFPIWSPWLDFQEFSVVYFECLDAAFLTLFARRYLRLREFLPRVDVINRVFIGYMLVLIPIASFLPYYFSSFMAVIPISFMILGIFMQSLFRALQGDRPAIVFSLGWSLCFTICIFVVVSNLGLTHNYVNSVYSLKMAFVTEYFVLLAGLGFRLYLLRRGQELGERQALTERAENQAKGEILARISHEIRTPLNGILGITDLLKRTSLDQQQTRYVGTVSEAGRSLLTMINDVLDHARIDSGHISLEHIPFSLPDLLDRVVDMFQVEAERKGLRLHFELDSDLPDQVIGDPTRFRQVVVNLLGNACKFTEQGAVYFRIRKDWADDNFIRLRVEVEDTGIGISSELRGVLFNSFTQGADDISRKFGGSGLGLTISRQLVELMGGSIDFKSVPGKGSRFWFQISFMPVNSVSDEGDFNFDISDYRFYGNKVLVAEDNDTNWVVVSAYLMDLGVEPVRAEDGVKAVELYRREHFDLVFLDCAMPGLSGFEVAAEMKAIESGEGRELIPIIALTAHVSETVRTQCLMSGMDDYLGKPFSREEIALVLKRYILPVPEDIGGVLN
ncbi:hybrid sensor histidine kinase/response regulator [Parendozoicomonas sp. Alg238-R29]|uniref:hybrid sensor histidine kinase/response regulator n=1 Tax=Parendozoicomonas sp. Alg238-R29 TaxID=2993446 RepID=UPI00248EC52F|nr:hybrid sensor histidine kinase/response regulator [Parendozoicomonas sp. Alg238-R29]